MRFLPLQLVEPDVPPDWVVLFQQSTDFLSVLVAAFIAYHAYRGYRRNDSRPMLFIAIGFVLVLLVPFLVFYLYALLPFVSVTVTVVLSQMSQLLGLVSILYALRIPS